MRATCSPLPPADHEYMVPAGRMGEGAVRADFGFSDMEGEPLAPSSSLTQLEPRPPPDRVGFCAVRWWSYPHAAARKGQEMSEEHLPADSGGKMVVFGAKQIRRIWHEEQWFFSVVDIIAVLTDSDNPRKYWNRYEGAGAKAERGPVVHTLCTTEANLF